MTARKEQRRMIPEQNDISRRTVTLPTKTVTGTAAAAPTSWMLPAYRQRFPQNRLSASASVPHMLYAESFCQKQCLRMRTGGIFR